MCGVASDNIIINEYWWWWWWWWWNVLIAFALSTTVLKWFSTSCEKWLLSEMNHSRDFKTWLGYRWMHQRNRQQQQAHHSRWQSFQFRFNSSAEIVCNQPYLSWIFLVCAIIRLIRISADFFPAISIFQITDWGLQRCKELPVHKNPHLFSFITLKNWRIWTKISGNISEKSAGLLYALKNNLSIC